MKADAFALAWLSDQPDRRKRFQYLTRCDVALSADSKFTFLSPATLQQERDCFVEESGFTFSKSLLSAAKYWMVHSTIYRETEVFRTVEVIGVRKSKGLFVGAVAAAEQDPPVDDNDVDPIEEACNELLNAKPKKPQLPDEAASDSGESLGLGSSAESGQEDDDEDDVDSEAALSDAADEMVDVTSEHFGREGKRVLWKNKLIGTISTWSGSTSATCSVHARCRSAASRYYPSDSVLIEWLLGAIGPDGKPTISKEEHAEQAEALKNQFR